MVIISIMKENHTVKNVHQMPIQITATPARKHCLVKSRKFSEISGIRDVSLVLDVELHSIQIILYFKDFHIVNLAILNYLQIVVKDVENQWLEKLL